LPYKQGNIVKEKEIKNFLKNLSLQEFTEDELPPKHQQRAFLEEQINGLTKEITRMHFDIYTYKEYLKEKDVIANRFAQAKLQEVKDQVKTYKLQLKAFLKAWKELPQDEDSADTTV
jgi:hypothetical protein